MSIEPLALGVCSWSLQVKSVAELKRLLDRLGTDVVQIACGDPHHAAWDEGDRMPEAARQAGLRLTLDELKCPNVKVNFDPANMLLYDKGDPLRAVEILGPDIRSVHVKDANRPTTPGTWGDEVPLGKGQVNIRQFVKTLQKVGYRGPLCIEREVGNQEERLADVAHGIRYLRECLSS